jgi:hypothetical protein
MMSPEGMKKHIGGGMEKQPELIGGKTAAGSAVGEKVILVLFDHKLHGAPAAIDFLINEAAVFVFQVGYDEAGVRTQGAVFHFGDNPAGLIPGLGFIAYVGKYFNRTAPLIIITGRLADKGLDFPRQRSIRLKPQRIFHIVLFTKIIDLGTGVMGIPPKKNPHFRPGLSNLFHHPLEDGYNLFAAGPLARTQDGGDQFAAFSLINVNGRVTVISMIRVKKTQLLVSVGQIIRVIHIQDNPLGSSPAGPDKHIHKPSGYPVKFRSRKTVLKTADGRLTGQLCAVFRRLPTGYFHHRIFPQLIGVVPILISAGNLENPLLDKFTKLMSDITWSATVPQGVGHFAYQTYPVFNLPEEKNSGIRTDLSTFKISFNFFTRNVFEIQQLFGTIFHGCFLFFFSLTYYISIRYERKQLFFMGFMNNPG